MDYYIKESPFINETLYPLIPEELLTLNYYSPSNNNKIAIVVTNFLRDRYTLDFIKSVWRYYPNIKFYIGEQGAYHPIKELFYKEMKRHGHEIIYTGFDAGLGVCRNKVLKEVKEPYVFLTDDDSLFTKETDLNKMLRLCETKADIVGQLEIKAQSDEIWHYEVDLEIKNNKIYYYKKWDNWDIEKNEYLECDMIMNSYLAKKEVFNKIKYDRNLKLAEHLDFFLQIKYHSNFKVICSNSKYTSTPMLNPPSIYKEFRARHIYYWQFYKNKWNVTHTVGFNNEEELIMTYTNPEQNKIEVKPIEIESKPVEELCKQEVIIEESQKISKIYSDSIDYLIEFSEILDKFKIDFYFSKFTCLQYILKKELKSPFQVSIKILSPEIKLELKNQGWIIDENKIKKNDTVIEIDTRIPFQFKYYLPIKGRQFKVPLPVVQYLDNYFGKDWAQKYGENV